ncbi:hypothetical protein TSAR_013376 [Trichomalopsis sarcophagae]|uniref:Uncharacterized protein n=1 Tax=Trichomalopsis sarcophagae TaxID=543379 RepID=A0A232EVQ6_9HYME|nr:hypothetical protein TSAR_013376 [Trichomalopsis sarcophagae]
MDDIEKATAKAAKYRYKLYDNSFIKCSKECYQHDVSSDEDQLEKYELERLKLSHRTKITMKLMIHKIKSALRKNLVRTMLTYHQSRSVIPMKKLMPKKITIYKDQRTLYKM